MGRKECVRGSSDVRAKQYVLSSCTCLRVQPGISSDMAWVPREFMEKHWQHSYAYACMWLQH